MRVLVVTNLWPTPERPASGPFVRDQVEALRGLLIGTPARLLLDVAVLAGAAVAGISVASAMLTRLAK